jgi:hypothetical protein
MSSSIPAWTGGQRFVPGDPFSMDRVEVWRMLETGTDDGTPVLKRGKVGELDCRIDSIRSRRSDLAFRTPVTATHENFAIIFAPANADIQNDDELRPLTTPLERWLVVEISRSQGPTYIHHLEITASRIQGEA